MSSTILETEEVFLIGLDPANIVMSMWNKMYSQVFVLIFSLILLQTVIINSIFRLSPSFSFELKSVHFASKAIHFIMLLSDAMEILNGLLFLLGQMKVLGVVGICDILAQPVICKHQN
jgi:hypothetical protein